MVDFSIITIARGLLGLTSLIFISFLLSNKKNSIRQFYLHFYSIYYCSFNFEISLIQSIFGFISKFFVDNNYTTSGSSFLFSSLVDQQKIHIHIRFSSFTSNFLFSFTSVLYHLVIQKIVSFRFDIK